MNKDLEQIFDKALLELKKGASLEDAILKCQPEQKNLAENLEIAVRLSKMPKIKIPQPSMQRKYALAPIKQAWYLSIHISRFVTVSMSILLLLSAGVGTGYAAWNSLPGQPLFMVKRNAEQLRIKFASTQIEKTNLQVELSKKRLTEARQALKDPSINTEVAQASIKELEKQTKTTLDTAKSIAKETDGTKQANSIITSLELLAKEQESLVKDAKTDGKKDVLAEAEETAKENVKQIAEVKNYILTAANGEADLVDLKPATVEDEAGDKIKGASTAAINTADKPSSTSTPKIETVFEEIKTAPEKVTGGYILEDPAPQFAP